MMSSRSGFRIGLRRSVRQKQTGTVIMVAMMILIMYVLPLRSMHSGQPIRSKSRFVCAWQ